MSPLFLYRSIGRIIPLLHMSGKIPEFQISLNNLQITCNIFSGTFFRYSFKILSNEDDLLFFKYLIDLSISSNVKALFNSFLILLYPHHKMWGGGYTGFALSRRSVGRSVRQSVGRSVRLQFLSAL